MVNSFIPGCKMNSLHRLAVQFLNAIHSTDVQTVCRLYLGARASDSFFKSALEGQHEPFRKLEYSYAVHSNFSGRNVPDIQTEIRRCVVGFQAHCASGFPLTLRHKGSSEQYKLLRLPHRLHGTIQKPFTSLSGAVGLELMTDLENDAFSVTPLEMKAPPFST